MSSAVSQDQHEDSVTSLDPKTALLDAKARRELYLLKRKKTGDLIRDREVRSRVMARLDEKLGARVESDVSFLEAVVASWVKEGGELLRINDPFQSEDIQSKCYAARCREWSSVRPENVKEGKKTSSTSTRHTNRPEESDMGDRDREEKFFRLAENRTDKTIKLIRRIGNLSNRSNYKYDDAAVSKIFRAIRKELNVAESRFRAKKKHEKDDKVFTFN